jgi:flotillin
MNLQAMTREKLSFLLPVVFTVGPDVNKRGANAPNADADLIAAEMQKSPTDGGDALMKYAILLSNNDKKNKQQEIQHQQDLHSHNGRDPHVEGIIKGIIEGETRVLISAMTMEEIFTERDEFKKRISTNIQTELDHFGLKIYNANVKELADSPGSIYFDSLSKKAHEGAVQDARVEVAKAQKRGTTGEQEELGKQNRELAKIQAETQVAKTERDTEKAAAEAKLKTNQTQFNREVNIAQIEATRATEARDEELRKDVEMKRAFTELERLRAIDVVKATVLKESKQQAADASK